MLREVAKKKRILLGILVTTAASLLSLFFLTDDFLESKVRSLAEDNGIELTHFDLEANKEGIFSRNLELKIGEEIDQMVLKVAKVFDKGSTWDLLNFKNKRSLVLRGIEFQGPEKSGHAKAKELEVKYDFAQLFDKKFSSLSLSSLNTSLDVEKIASILRKNQNFLSHESPRHSFSEFLENPNFSFLRVRDSYLTSRLGKEEYHFSYNAKAQLTADFAYFELDGEFSGVPIKSDFTFNKEGGEILLTSEIVLPDLKDAGKALIDLDGLGFLSTPSLNLKNGFVKARSTAFINEDLSLESPFFEINGSDLHIGIGLDRLKIDKCMTFLSGNKKNLVNEATAYANFSLNDQFQGVGANLYARFPSDENTQKQGFGLGGKIWKLIGIDPTAKFEIQGVSLPYFEVNRNKPITQIFEEPRTINFSSFTLGDHVLTAEKGSISLRATKAFDEFGVKILSTSASLPKIQLSFHEISYDGVLNLAKFPSFPDRQTLNITQVLVGDDYQVDDFVFRFSSKSKTDLLIDEISFSPPNSHIKLYPANLSLSITEGPSEKAFCLIEMNEGKIMWKRNAYDLEIEGISGFITVNKLDPFSTAPNQTITFEKIKFEGLEFTDGKLNFTIQEGPVIQIKNISFSGLGGTIGLSESTISPNDGETVIRIFLDQIKGQKIVELFDNLDLEIGGNFSGMIPLAPSKLSGKWDYMGGSLRMENNGSSRFKWDAKGRLTEGMDKKSKDYKQNLLAEKALANLLVKSMKFDFMVFDKGREVRGIIDGISEVEGKKINLDYNPVIFGNLEDLLNLADIFKLGSDD